jgi:hypothetical protein
VPILDTNSQYVISCLEAWNKSRLLLKMQIENTGTFTITPKKIRTTVDIDTKHLMVSVTFYVSNMLEFQSTKALVCGHVNAPLVGSSMFLYKLVPVTNALSLRFYSVTDIVFSSRLQEHGKTAIQKALDILVTIL